MMKSPDLKPLLRTLLQDIPPSIDLSEVTISTSAPLDKALSSLHEIRTQEIGPITTSLETLIEKVYMTTGEYHP
jgi:hypothetical protein